MTCAKHSAPTFGCLDCIKSDRESFAAESYRLWKTKFKLPRCKSCGAGMIHYGRNTYPSRVEAILICPGRTEDGVATCEDEDIVLVIA